MRIFDALALFPLTYAAVSDFRRRIIPDWTVITVLILAVLKVMLGLQSWRGAVLGLVIGLAPLTLALRSKGDGIGGGDVKLIAAMCALSGPISGILVLGITFIAAAITGAILRRRRLPLAPFLCAGFALFNLIPFFI